MIVLIVLFQIQYQFIVHVSESCFVPITYLVLVYTIFLPRDIKVKHDQIYYLSNLEVLQNDLVFKPASWFHFLGIDIFYSVFVSDNKSLKVTVF